MSHGKLLAGRWLAGQAGWARVRSRGWNWLEEARSKTLEWPAGLDVPELEAEAGTRWRLEAPSKRLD